MMVTADALLGAWTLREWRVEVAGSGRTAWPFGPDASGLLVYAPAGWMSATLSQRARTPLSATSARQADERSRALAMSEYLAYTARWSIESGILVHVIVLSLNPVLIGTRQVRTASFQGNDLVLAATETVGGDRRTHRLAWQRA